MRERVRDTGRSPLRTATLAALIIALAGSSFESTPISTASYGARYVLAALLFVLTFSQGSNSTIRFAHLPGPARLLVSSAWVMTAAGLLSIGWSISPRESALQTVVFALLAANMHVHTTRRWHHLNNAVADMTTIFWVLALTIVLSLATGAAIGGRLAGLYSNPNSLGILAALTISLGVGIYQEQGARYRVGVLLACALSAVALLATSSRTAAAAVVVGLVLVWLRRKTFPPGAIIAACLGGSTVALIYALNYSIPLPAVVGRFETTDEGSRFSNREAVWEYTLELWERRPYTGYGFRAGEIAFEQSRTFSAPKGNAAFNSYLQVLLELGYIGMIPLVGLVAGLLWAAYRARGGLNGGLAVLVLTGLATGATESSLFGLGHPIAWVFWLAAAALAARSNPYGRGHERQSTGEAVQTISGSAPLGSAK